MLQKIARDYIEKYGKRPDLWAEEVLGVKLWSKQREILLSVFENPITVVRACHSTGKTFLAGVAVLAFMFLKIPCKVLTTAPSFYQVKDLLWAEVNKLWNLRIGKPELGFPGRMTTTRFTISHDWFAEGLSPKTSVNFHGYHQKHVLGVFDESPGVRKEVVEGAMSLLASGDCHILHIGNPTSMSGHFWELFSTKDLGLRVGRFHISYKDTPSFTGEPFAGGYLITKDYVEFMAKKYGENSPIFQSKCLGEFPAEGEDQVISYALATSAIDRDVVDDTDEIVMGVDVARYGTDLTCLVKRKGNRVLSVETLAGRSVMEVVGKIVSDLREDNIKMVVVDEVGIGAGVVDRLLELKSAGEIGCEVLGVNTGEKAIDRAVYYNRRTELWFVLRDYLKEACIPNNDDLVADLVSTKYRYTSDARYQVESKDDVKKRLGRSTDLADALMLSLAVNSLRMNWDFITATSYSADDVIKGISDVGLE